MIARITSTGFEALTNSLIGNSPIGTIVSYAGESLPAGYLLCNGGSLDETVYPELASLLNSTTLPTITDETTLGYRIIKALQVTAASVGSVASVVTIPTIEIGTVVDYAGSIVPDHYLPCDGSEFDSEKYSDLYNILGTNKLPDLYDPTSMDGSPVESITLPYTCPSDGYVSPLAYARYPNNSYIQVYNENDVLIYQYTAGISTQVSGDYLTSGFSPFYVKKGWILKASGTINAVFKPVLKHRIIRSDREDMTDLVEKVDAIEECDHYKTYNTAQFTGRYWVDGKKIYRAILGPAPFVGTVNGWTEFPVGVTNVESVLCCALSQGVHSGYVPKLASPNASNSGVLIWSVDNYTYNYAYVEYTQLGDE